MIFAVDPGSKGAIVWGLPGENELDFISTPKKPNDWFNILEKIKKNMRPDSIFLVERTEPFFSAKANPYEVLAATKLAREQGKWDIASLGILRYDPTPATWRKSVFGNAREHKGHEWKDAELSMAIKRFPKMDWGKYREFRPKGDHEIYGRAAACCIWIYGEKLLLKGEL